MKKILLLALIVLSAFVSNAQETSTTLKDETQVTAGKKVSDAADTTQKGPWFIKNKLILTAEEAYYKNWIKDGFNSFSFTGYYTGKYNYIKDKNRWENTLDLAYGMLSQDLDGDGALDKTNHPRKTDDKLNFSSAYNRSAIGNWYYNATLDFRSQFTETYKADTQFVADFLAPAYVLMAIGANYETNGFSALLSAITARTTVVNNDYLSSIGAYGVTPGDKALFEFGSYIKLTYTHDIFTNVNLATKLELFYDYRRQLIHETDVNWELFLNMKINKYLSAFFAMQTLYDTDTDAKNSIQFKEKLGLMVSWDF